TARSPAFSLFETPASTEAPSEAKNPFSKGLATEIGRSDHSDSGGLSPIPNLAILDRHAPPPIGASAPPVGFSAGAGAAPDARGKPAARRARHRAAARAQSPAWRGLANRAPRPDCGSAGATP